MRAVWPAVIILRDERAYLSDVVEACEAIDRALEGQDLDAYRFNLPTSIPM
jgi:hypothetical protein